MISFPSTAHLDALRAGQSSLNNVLPLLDKAEACGLDCTEYRQGQATLRGRIDAYLREFFPDQIVPGDATGLHRHDG